MLWIPRGVLVESSRNPRVVLEVAHSRWPELCTHSLTALGPQFPQPNSSTGSELRRRPNRHVDSSRTPCQVLEESPGSAPIGTHVCTTGLGPWKNSRMARGWTLNSFAASTAAHCSSSSHPPDIPTPPRHVSWADGPRPQNPQCLLLLQFFFFRFLLENRVCGNSARGPTDRFVALHIGTKQGAEGSGPSRRTTHRPRG